MPSLNITYPVADLWIGIVSAAGALQLSCTRTVDERICFRTRAAECPGLQLRNCSLSVTNVETCTTCGSDMHPRVFI